MSETALDLRRSRQENAEPARARELDARDPERRLADPSLALQHERGSRSNSVTRSAMRFQKADACSSLIRAWRMNPHSLPSRYAASDSRAATAKSLKSSGIVSASGPGSTATKNIRAVRP